MRLALALLAVGCASSIKANDAAGGGSVTPTTQVAVENAGSGEVDILLVSPAGEASFPGVAAGTTTDYEDVDDWGADLDLTVTVEVGAVQGGELTIEEDFLNVVVLSDDAPPDLKTYEPEPGGPGDPRW